VPADASHSSEVGAGATTAESLASKRHPRVPLGSLRGGCLGGFDGADLDQVLQQAPVLPLGDYPFRSHLVY
jgi:hypothetical protein